MSSQLLSPEEVAQKISRGQPLVLAGDESLLSKLPVGKWIGGTIPYFMAANGGCLCKDKVFVTDLPAEIDSVQVLSFDRHSLPDLNTKVDSNDVSILIIPGGSNIHADFAMNAPKYEGFATHPLIGWISGVDLKDLATTKPKVFCGNGHALEDAAVVLRFRLPKTKYANINIINLFKQGEGDVIRFTKGGFSVSEAEVNGKKCNLAAYLSSIGADAKLPLVADYCGASINVSFKSVDTATGKVEFYAPVWADIDYKLAAPIGDYVAGFSAKLSELSPGSIVFSCNCILNYLYSELEGKKTGGVVGPVTFGEVAYQLLNQTMAYLTIDDLS
jgi:hypothetical protein